jgi:hypothetical protein
MSRYALRWAGLIGDFAKKLNSRLVYRSFSYHTVFRSWISSTSRAMEQFVYFLSSSEKTMRNISFSKNIRVAFYENNRMIDILPLLPSELYTYARSPYNDLRAWDRAIQYDRPTGDGQQRPTNILHPSSRPRSRRPIARRPSSFNQRQSADESRTDRGRN